MIKYKVFKRDRYTSPWVEFFENEVAAFGAEHPAAHLQFIPGPSEVLWAIFEYEEETAENGDESSV